MGPGMRLCNSGYEVLFHQTRMKPHWMFARPVGDLNKSSSFFGRYVKYDLYAGSAGEAVW